MNVFDILQKDSLHEDATELSPLPFVLALFSGLVMGHIHLSWMIEAVICMRYVFSGYVPDRQEIMMGQLGSASEFVTSVLIGLACPLQSHCEELVCHQWFLRSFWYLPACVLASVSHD
ncbi:hypothetical protein NPIL_618811 [Nephila pilipes]|uniref:Uncharacterized protein n=1 Tax=Nephila pilipes TaxID=299642 RepID=A0A8X6U136_NEPPI|nr:hypothetical protein NPIL_618811 [Nephila pilipes]